MQKVVDKESSKKTRTIIGIIIVSIAAIFIFALIVGNLNQSDGITQSIAEKTCSDEATLKMQGRGISVVSLDNYNPQFYKTNDGTNEYTLWWNGKQSNGENSLQFVCKISGTRQNQKIESLQYGAEQL